MNLRHSLLILSILITFPLICIGQDSIKDTVQYIDTTSITDSLEKAEEFIYYKIDDISDMIKTAIQFIKMTNIRNHFRQNTLAVIVILMNSLKMVLISQLTS